MLNSMSILLTVVRFLDALENFECILSLKKMEPDSWNAGKTRQNSKSGDFNIEQFCVLSCGSQKYRT